MATPQQHMPTIPTIPGYGMISTSDLYLESYLIVDDRRLDKWYLKSFNEQLNKATWTQDIKKAKEFDSRNDAITFGDKMKREFFVEEQENWIW